MVYGNEVGTAEARGRDVVPLPIAEEELSRLARSDIHLPDNAVVHKGPETCPACGSFNVVWGCDPDINMEREQVHPLIWDETQWMADTFLCRDCDAGWIEPYEREPITWVRPYWRI